MGKISTELKDMLTEFLVCEIGSKAMDGITYALMIKSNKNEEAIERYHKIRSEASNCGFNTSEVFRIYEVGNGYIFDLDMSVAKRLSYALAKAVFETNGGETPITDFIGSRPEKRRKADMVGLSRFVKTEFEKGKDIIEAALFSKNSSPRIMISGIGPKDDMITIKYNAYAIRHWDIESVNSNLLMPDGIRIAKIQPCEILPSQTGVKFRLLVSQI